jgi:hypothetical protein
VSRARILALSFVAALALSSGALAQGGGAGGGGGGVAQVALAVEQVERAVHPEPQATQAAREAVRVAPAATAPAARAKAVRVAIALLNPPAARARIA